jgi:hypothetical protein
LFLIVCIFALQLSVKAQECGYAFLYIYLNDDSGKPVENAEFIFANNKDGCLKYDAKVKWISEDKAYLVSHGMCGDHKNINIKISAKEFAPIENNFDFTFGIQSYILKLKKEGSKEKADIEQLANFDGSVKDVSGENIKNIKIILTNQNGEKFETLTSEYGSFEYQLKSGQYKIELIGTKGFATIKFDNLQIPKGQPFLKIVLPTDPNCNNCLTVELVCKTTDWGRDVCELITKNTNKQK